MHWLSKRQKFREHPLLRDPKEVTKAEDAYSGAWEGGLKKWQDCTKGRTIHRYWILKNQADKSLCSDRSYVWHNSDKQPTAFAAESESREVKKVLLWGQALGANSNWKAFSVPHLTGIMTCSWPGEVSGEVLLETPRWSGSGSTGPPGGLGVLSGWSLLWAELQASEELGSFGFRVGSLA